MTEEEQKHVDNLERLLERFAQEGYKYKEERNDIHDCQSIQFGQNYLKYDQWTVDVLTNGLKINLKRKPGRYEERNNKSATNNMGVLKQKVDTWEREGKLHKVEHKPLIISPMSVVEKLDWMTGETKYRPVIDHSRYVNRLIEDKPCKLNDLAYFDPLWTPQMYMTSFDLRSMYHHVKLTECSKELFGFKLPKEDGFQYYRFDVLMFGSKPATWITSKLLKPAINYFRSLGICTGIFVDDGAMLNSNPRVLEVETKFVITVMQILGWNISWEKSTLIPTQLLTYQGFEIDTIKMEYRLPKPKVKIFTELIDSVLDKAQMGQLVSAKELSSIFGKAASSRRSHGPAIHMALRHSQHKVGQRVMHRGIEEEPDWSVDVLIDQQMARELIYVKNHLVEWNGYPIPSDKTVHIFNVNGTEFRQSEPWSNQGKSYKVMVSDASDKVAFVYEAESFNLVEEYGFSQQEMEMSSGVRELQAVSKALSHRADYFVENPGRVYWITDSKNVYYFLKKGSRKSHIQKMVMGIKAMEKSYGIQVIPIWQPRDTIHIVLADIGSKQYMSTDEWSMDTTTFKKIQKTLRVQVTVDGFATSENTKCAKFFSKYPQVGSTGINFFAQELSSQEVYWVCPPVSQVIRAIKHILNSKSGVVALVSFPEWVSANYWTFVMKGNNFASYVAAVFYSRPRFECFNEASNIFRGYTRFRMITVLINTHLIDK